MFLFDTATLTLKSRLLGESPRIESLAFSPDSTRLAVECRCPRPVWRGSGLVDLGGTHFRLARRGRFGFWHFLVPDGTRLAFGGVDKSTHVISATDGKELVKFDNHSDWVLRTAWVAKGDRLLSGSRDRAVKLINGAERSVHRRHQQAHRARGQSGGTSERGMGGLWRLRRRPADLPGEGESGAHCGQ